MNSYIEYKILFYISYYILRELKSELKSDASPVTITIDFSGIQTND